MSQINQANWNRDFELLGSPVLDMSSHSPGCRVSVIVKDSDNFSALKGCLVAHDFCYF